MNTNAVSKLLHVSARTILRWVKILELQLERNELGHYLYTDEDVKQLKRFQEKIQQGIPTEHAAATIIKRDKPSQFSARKENHQKLIVKIKELENQLENKADAVVTYQILQHRSEIEDLKEQIQALNKQIEKLTKTQPERKNTNTEFEQPEQKLGRPRRRKLISSIFGM